MTAEVFTAYLKNVWQRCRKEDCATAPARGGEMPAPAAGSTQAAAARPCGATASEECRGD
ncbi:hypothetical protein LAZ40_01150 [Cereibacter sphaeroides]|uniref:hypothetical protein n=1 Tax=Cereibacter sphaeroides TaxID=1063 RepID=UPI001F15E2BF|nr:hypothetical protein [Cereibacter sphaeroides]MCE6957673.1 hypothetical protein [Cereibacter sphaeroides]MCE6971407.1 hypothetical protein [Cereibacter sphaeroides]